MLVKLYRERMKVGLHAIIKMKEDRDRAVPQLPDLAADMDSTSERRELLRKLSAIIAIVFTPTD